VIPLGVDEAFRPLSDRRVLADARAGYGLHGTVILFVGNPDPRKNLPGLVRAFRTLRSSVPGGCTLALAGHGGWGRTMLVKEVRALNIAEDVVFLGYVPVTELVALYSLADVFVFPSLYEGFGLPPLEAMACGLPVVCSKAEACMGVVGDAALTVDSADPDALAGALERVLTDAGLRARLVEKGRRRVRRFQWREAAASVEKVYESVLGYEEDESRGVGR
jgi:glycosyltransferase involved in cell wall biosynthesis